MGTVLSGSASSSSSASLSSPWLLSRPHSFDPWDGAEADRAELVAFGSSEDWAGLEVEEAGECEERRDSLLEEVAEEEEERLRGRPKGGVREKTDDPEAFANVTAALRCPSLSL